LFTGPDVAVIVVVPATTLVVNPDVLIVATPGLAEVHVTVVVRFSVLPSL
jgi:hypothetical protein